MEEAVPLNKDYKVINELAVLFGRETGLINLFNIKDIIALMGGKIRYVADKEYKESIFIKFNGVNNFEILMLNDMEEQFERVLLIQAIGHYILHAESGNNVCCVSSASKGQVAKEGFLFSLSLLIPDHIFLKLKDSFDDIYISKLFRVPLFVVEAKRKIINQIY